MDIQTTLIEEISALMKSSNRWDSVVLITATLLFAYTMLLILNRKKSRKDEDVNNG